MDWTGWELPPVGVRLLSSSKEAPAVPVYHGVSYCDAVRRAGQGEPLRVLPGSIEVCGWSPVVLGLKEPAGRFEEGLAPRLAFPVAGLLLAPLDRFPGLPDLVVVRAGPERIRDMARLVGREELWDGAEGDLDSSQGYSGGGGLDRSATALLLGELSTPRQGLIGGMNHVLAALARSRRWRAFTHWIFRSHLVTAGFDAIISRTMADMSICRNSTTIPLLTGRANISFFCSGGITWGRNQPGHLTSGWPWHHFQRAIQFPQSFPSQGEADD